MTRMKKFLPLLMLPALLAACTPVGVVAGTGASLATNLVAPSAKTVLMPSGRM